MADYSVYNEFVAFLYFFLALTATVRLVKKLREVGCSVPPKSRQSIVVLIVLIAYAVARAIQLLLEGLNIVPQNGGLENHFYTTIPATFFLLLQTAFIWKWVGHVGELTLALQSNRFRLGNVSIIISLVLCIAVDVLTIAVAIVTRSGQSTLTDTKWNEIVTFVCGVAYFFNGCIFIFLGILLRSLWAPNSDDGISASRRVLGIALLFGVVCCARGFILSLYSMDRFHGVDHVTHSGWGAPTVLVCEWVSICVTLYLLTMHKGGGGGTASNVQQQQDADSGFLGSGAGGSFGSSSLGTHTGTGGSGGGGGEGASLLVDSGGVPVRSSPFQFVSRAHYQQHQQQQQLPQSPPSRHSMGPGGRVAKASVQRVTIPRPDNYSSHRAALLRQSQEARASGAEYVHVSTADDTIE